jgi:predicted MPP superfamily phosphohydrolase
MSLKIIIFPLVVFCIMLAMHGAVFKSAMHFFSVTRPSHRLLAYAAMVLLSMSFISAFVLIHWHENPVTIAYYKFAAIWTGFIIHCLTAAAAAWLCLAVIRLAGSDISLKWLGALMLALALAESGYGIWAAFYPQIRQVNVSVKAVPEQWKNSSIVLLSDLHLGHMHKHGFLRRVIEMVNSQNPDLILITGDLVDGMGGDYEKNLMLLNDLKPGRGIFFVTGNHEHYVGLKKSLDLISKTPLKILDNELIEIDGLEILGVSYPGINSVSDIGNLRQTRKPGCIRIAMFHTPTEMGINYKNLKNQHVANYWMPDTNFRTNTELDIDLQLSGHSHHGQLFPLNFLTGFLYKGYDYGLNNTGAFWLYTTSGTGSWGPPMRTSGRAEIPVIRLVENKIK